MSEFPRSLKHDPKPIWKCTDCQHIWLSKVDGILNSGSGCPNCKHKNEKALKKLLGRKKISYQSQCMLNRISEIDRKFRVDFYLPDLKVIIEYNGHQHYTPVRYGNISQEEAEEKFRHQQIRDEFVREFCRKHEIMLIEIDGRTYYGKSLSVFFYEELFPLLEKISHTLANKKVRTTRIENIVL